MCQDFSQADLCERSTLIVNFIYEGMVDYDGRVFILAKSQHQDGSTQTAKPAVPY